MVLFSEKLLQTRDPLIPIITKSTHRVVKLLQSFSGEKFVHVDPLVQQEADKIHPVDRAYFCTPTHNLVRPRSVATSEGFFLDYLI